LFDCSDIADDLRLIAAPVQEFPARAPVNRRKTPIHGQLDTMVCTAAA
jgi:hypothetical protein